MPHIKYWSYDPVRVADPEREEKKILYTKMIKKKMKKEIERREK